MKMFHLSTNFKQHNQAKYLAYISYGFMWIVKPFYKIQRALWQVFILKCDMSDIIRIKTTH